MSSEEMNYTLLYGCLIEEFEFGGCQEKCVGERIMV